MHDTDTELLQTLLLTFERAMLVSRRADSLHARPMSLAPVRDAKRLWLLSSVAGDRFEELAEDPNVNVVLQDGSRFCSVSGTARVARRVCESLASDVLAGRARAGASSGGLLLVQVTPQFAEYWDRSGSNGIRFEAAEEGESCAPVGDSPRTRRRRDCDAGDAGVRPRKAFDNVIRLERSRWKK
jgi:general stress protein 26